METIRLEAPQSVCTVKDERGNICAGYLKEWMTAPQEALMGLPSGYKLYRCRTCGKLYASPPQQHLRASKKPTPALPPVGEGR